MTDLIVLVEGKDDEAVVRSLLRDRHKALAIRSVQFDVEVHPRRGPGCLREAHTFLQAFSRQYDHALVIFDRVGAGDDADALALEAQVTDRLSRAGWGDRAAAIVIDPELEVWLWSPSPHVDECLGWAQRSPSLREWLRSTKQWIDTPKPPDPKRAVETALRAVNIGRSSFIYGDIASRVSVDKCGDASFHRFKSVLGRWFAST